MFEIVSEHQFWTAVVIYWIFSAAVSSIIKASPWRARASRPEPGPNGSPAYLWFYRFLHSIAGNITTAFGSKIPGVKTMTVILLIPILLSVSACRAHYAIHPGALNTADSAAYDTLLVASATIDEARMAYQLGRLPIGARDLLNTLIHSYKVARQSWLTYRGAIATNVAPDIYFDELTENLKDLTTAIRAFHERMRMQARLGRSHKLKEAK